MISKEYLKTSDKLLIAAFNLEKSGKQPFSAEDLVVSAWQLYPDVFGLAGYRDEDGQLAYPNSNRIFAEIMGSKPIRKNGFLKKVGSKMYQLTEAGRDRASNLLNANDKKRVEKIGLAREIEQHLKRLFMSKVVEKIKNNRSEDITFYEACVFWGISPRSSAIEFEGKIANFLKIIDTAMAAAKDKTVSFKQGGNSFGINDLSDLLHIHEFLMERFAEETSVIKKRIDERIT